MNNNSPHTRYTLRPDGSPVVLRSTLELLLEISPQKSNGPDFSSLKNG
jgi:hypothetical protein